MKIKVNGMSCASCAMTVEKALEKVPNVTKATVNLTTNEATIEESDPVEEERLYQAIEKAGYEPVRQQEELSFKVNGMSCASCAMTIEKAVNQLENVTQAHVNLANESLAVTGHHLSSEDIEKAVDKAGYTAVMNGVEAKDTAKPAIHQVDEGAALKKRVWLSLIFTVPLLYISMGAMIGLPGAVELMKYPVIFACVQLILTLPVLYLGRSFFIQGFKALRIGAPNMDSLVAMGTSAAFLYSVYNTILVIAGQSHAIHQLYFESAATILTLITLGNYFETVSKGKASQAIYELLSLAPDKAWKKVGNSFEEVLVSTLKKGDIIQVKAGEKVPIDGQIIQGATTVDESMITGESQPVYKDVDASVIGGSLNHDGTIQVVVTHTGEDTLLYKMVTLVEEAQSNKAPIAKVVDKVSRFFVPTVMILAFMSAILWKTVGHESWSFAITIFVSVLVIACPCALGLATPMALMLGTGSGAKQGILIKNSSALEILNHVDAIVFDKTGTLTVGKPSVTAVVAKDKVQLLMLAASLEQVSTHPLAHAIVTAAKQEGVDLVEACDVVTKVGQGLIGTIEHQTVMVGNEALMHDEAVMISEEMQRDANRLQKEGKTLVYVAYQDQVIGMMGIEDTLKQEAKAMVATLKQWGITPVMMTGDHEGVAQRIADAVGITEVYSNVYPEDKARLIADKQASGAKVAMVGDGINDAPALALADVGIAMGSGTDIAIESADVVLMNAQLETLLKAITLSKRTMRNVKENLVWAFGYNILGIPIAMGLLYIFGGPLLNPMIAGAAMSLSSVSVVLNALRLKLK